MNEFDPAAEAKPLYVMVEPAKNRGPAWLLVGLGVGFLLPLCACMLLVMGTAVSLANFNPNSSTATLWPDNPLVGPAIAIVRVEGAIMHSDDPDYVNGAGSGRVIADLRAAEHDDEVKAIVLRVDSPGGTVTGSAEIHEEIEAMDKPVVVSMGGTAASGGYYVSAPADYIFARPDTTTGSLGVILTLYNIQELMDEFGVAVTSITSGDNKGIGNPWETLTPEQEAILSTYIDESYAEFVRIIADGRGLDEAVVREMADGRIYTGRQALALGLVDELGNLQNAIDKAAELGGITGQPRIVEYERLPSFGNMLLGLQSRLNQTRGDEIMSTIYEFTAPKFEYRYGGN
jgi:protease IV